MSFKLKRLRDAAADEMQHGGFQIHGNRVNGQPKPIVLETYRIKVRPESHTGCRDCGTPCWNSPFKGCPAEAMVAARDKALKHPSAKTTDEAEPLRLKVAELEGRLALKEQQPVVGAGGLYTMALVAFMGLGAVLGFLCK